MRSQMGGQIDVHASGRAASASFSATADDDDIASALVFQITFMMQSVIKIPQDSLHILMLHSATPTHAQSKLFRT